MNKIFFLFLLILIFGCNIESDLNINYDYQNENIIVNSILSNEYGIEAVINNSKIINNELKNYHNNHVRVELITNSSRIDTLRLSKDSVYRLNLFKPNKNYNYQLRIKDTLLNKELLSEIIILPDDKIKLTIDTSLYNLNNRISLNISDLNENQKFIIFLAEYDISGNLLNEIRTINNYEINSFIINYTNKNTFNFSINSNTKSIIGNVIILDNPLASYLNSLKLQQSSFDDKFLEPAQINGNIKNGFGIFGSYYLHQIKLNL